jgi:hypothetical protein
VTHCVVQVIVALTSHQVDAGLAGKKIMSRTPKTTEIQLRWVCQPYCFGSLTCSNIPKDEVEQLPSSEDTRRVELDGVPGRVSLQMPLIEYTGGSRKKTIENRRERVEHEDGAPTLLSLAIPHRNLSR